MTSSTPKPKRKTTKNVRVGLSPQTIKKVQDYLEVSSTATCFSDALNQLVLSSNLIKKKNNH